jgi:hypothetical protein
MGVLSETIEITEDNITNLTREHGHLQFRCDNFNEWDYPSKVLIFFQCDAIAVKPEDFDDWCKSP